MKLNSNQNKSLVGKIDFLRVTQLVAGPYVEQLQLAPLYITHMKVTSWDCTYPSHTTRFSGLDWEFLGQFTEFSTVKFLI